MTTWYRFSDTDQYLTVCKIDSNVFGSKIIWQPGKMTKCYPWCRIISKIQHNVKDVTMLVFGRTECQGKTNHLVFGLLGISSTEVLFKGFGLRIP